MFKIVWLGIDPLRMDDLLNRTQERFIAEIFYSFLFAIYAIILLV
jgi:hypothetical protein